MTSFSGASPLPPFSAFLEWEKRSTRVFVVLFASLLSEFSFPSSRRVCFGPPELHEELLHFSLCGLLWTCCLTSRELYQSLFLLLFPPKSSSPRSPYLSSRPPVCFTVITAIYVPSSLILCVPPHFCPDNRGSVFSLSRFHEGSRFFQSPPPSFLTLMRGIHSRLLGRDRSPAWLSSQPERGLKGWGGGFFFAFIVELAASDG